MNLYNKQELEEIAEVEQFLTFKNLAPLFSDLDSIFVYMPEQERPRAYHALANEGINPYEGKK